MRNPKMKKRQIRVRKPYKITIIYIPDSPTVLYYVYHFDYCFGAIFKSKDDIEKYMDGYDKRSYQNSRWY